MNARYFYQYTILHALNINQDACIVRRCFQEAVDVGLDELDFCANSEDYVDGRLGELLTALTTILQKLLSSKEGADWLRGCLKRFHRNAETFQFVGISIALIAFRHDTYMNRLLETVR